MNDVIVCSVTDVSSSRTGPAQQQLSAQARLGESGELAATSRRMAYVKQRGPYLEMKPPTRNLMFLSC